MNATCNKITFIPFFRGENAESFELNPLESHSVGIRTHGSPESGFLATSSTSSFLSMLAHTLVSHLENVPPKQILYSISLIIA